MGIGDRRNIGSRNPAQGCDHFSFFGTKCIKCENLQYFPSRNARRCGLTGVSHGAPLLQFWHHEVTDPRAKAKPKEGFQRDRGIPATSKNLRNSYCFLTLAEKLFHPKARKRRAFYDNSGLDLRGARGVYPPLPRALRSYLEPPAPPMPGSSAAGPQGDRGGGHRGI